MTRNLKLGEILKNAGIIDDFQLDSALSYQRHWGGRFGASLIKLGYISEEELQSFLARQFELPQIELSDRNIPDDVLAYIPADKALEFQVIPVERRIVNSKVRLVVAMTDPTNLWMIDSLQFMTGCRINPALAAAESIEKAIKRHYFHDEDDDQEKVELLLDKKPEISEPHQPTFAQSEALPAHSALKELENRYENLVRILLDRGIIDTNDLDELM